MHSPVLAPVQGIPWISGRLLCAGAGIQTPVAGSCTSPMAQSATGAGVLVVGTAKTATAGAAAIATATPPARISRRAGVWVVAIVTLSVVVMSDPSGDRRGPGSRRAGSPSRRRGRPSYPALGRRHMTRRPPHLAVVSVQVQ